MSGAIHSSGIPLRSSGWLSTGHMLAQADLEKWLVQLCLALQPLHDKKRLYGAVSPDHVLLDPQGEVHMAAGHDIPFEGRAASTNLHEAVNEGFAAFEQYVDDEAWPQGPWTDIYGMSALARSLILKQPPPDALRRMVSDTCEPLLDMELPAYSQAFLETIDRGMSLLPQQRFASVDAFAQGLGLSLAPLVREQSEPVVMAAPVPESPPSAAVVAPLDASEPGQTKKKVPIWMMVFVATALIAAGAYFLRGQGADIAATATPQGPVVAAAPESVRETAEPLNPAPAQPPAMEPEVGESTAAMLEQTSAMDMEAHAAARSLLAAAEQEAAEQQTQVAQAARVEMEAVDVEAAKPASASVRVGLAIKPWGEVFIDGTSQGVSPPLRSLSLKPGEYRVRVVNGDLPSYQRTFTVQAGESVSIVHEFESE